MGIVFRQSIKATLVLFTGVMLGAAFTFLSTLVIPPQELGGSRDMLARAAVLQLAFLMGTGSLVQTFSQRYSNDDPRKPVLITLSLFTPIIVALLASIPYFLLRDLIISRYQVTDRPFLDKYYSLILILSVLLSYMTQLEHYLASQYKVAASIFMREVLLRVMLMLLLGAFYFNLISFPQFIMGLVFVHAVPLAGLVMLARSTEGFFISTKWSVFSRKDYKEIVHYSWYHMLTGVSLNLLSFVDVLLLGPLSKSGFADVAVYTTAQFFIAIIVVPYRAMAGAAFPKLNDAWIRSDHSALASLFNRAGLNMLIVAAAMWLLVCCNLQNFVTFFRPAYAPLVPVVLILSIGRLVDMSTGLNTELISVTNYYKFNFRMSVILLVAVVILDRIFIPKAGIYGAAWVASMTLVAFNIVKMIYLYRKTGLQPFSKSSMLVLAAGLAAFFASLLLPALQNRFADIFVRSAVIMLTYTLILIMLRPSADLSEFLVQLRRNKRLF